MFLKIKLEEVVCTRKELEGCREEGITFAGISAAAWDSRRESVCNTHAASQNVNVVSARLSSAQVTVIPGKNPPCFKHRTNYFYIAGQRKEQNTQLLLESQEEQSLTNIPLHFQEWQATLYASTLISCYEYFFLSVSTSTGWFQARNWRITSIYCQYIFRIAPRKGFNLQHTGNHFCWVALLWLLFVVYCTQHIYAKIWAYLNDLAVHRITPHPERKVLFLFDEWFEYFWTIN